LTIGLEVRECRDRGVGYVDLSAPARGATRHERARQGAGSGWDDHGCGDRRERRGALPQAAIFNADGSYRSDAGRITSTVGTPRQMQLGLKFVW